MFGKCFVILPKTDQVYTNKLYDFLSCPIFIFYHLNKFQMYIIFNEKHIDFWTKQV